MSEPEDNTTEEREPSRQKRERGPLSYYYDDATGYEIYDPSQDDEEEAAETEEKEPEGE